ncbi:sugar phosphate isomerase/epimerase [Asaia sp. As-1742]|uniref:sugar phosphate isomerase/epimerase family protein n=1 Tax=Asaia sp. As-1742 TaxID=2608325 RepID=UPI00141E0746|nr:sugar phosphate isomerase/epimerase family protein [Asaia sp. As-1742]NIE79046.1 sugar phosphate isomerase/epimerase [Asaia sp. As-1742]
MRTALHGITSFHSNLLTDIRLAHEAGFDDMEIFYPKLARYLSCGGTIDTVQGMVRDAGMGISHVSALDHIERHDASGRAALMEEAVKITREAHDLGAPTVMVLPRNGADHLSDPALMDVMVQNIASIAAIGGDWGVRYMIELPAFTRFRTLTQAKEVIARVGAPNVGGVVDFWHFHGSGAIPADLDSLDPARIFGVHFCDGRLPRPGEAWDETVLRDCMPGEGEIDLSGWCDAVRRSGYAGPWSVELISPALWECDPAFLLPRLQGVLRGYMTTGCSRAAASGQE